MNDGKGYCDHDWNDPVCACGLEAIIEERDKLENLSRLVGIDLNSDQAKHKYYNDPYVYNLVNILKLVMDKHEEACKDLKWACLYIMGEYEEDDGAGFRAYNIFKKLRREDEDIHVRTYGGLHNRRDDRVERTTEEGPS